MSEFERLVLKALLGLLKVCIWGSRPDTNGVAITAFMDIEEALQEDDSASDPS